MPTFQFLLHTTGIRYHFEDESDAPAIGFYSVRRKRAKTSKEAFTKIMEAFDSDPSIIELVQSGYDAGLRPKTDVEEIHKISCLKSLLPWKQPGLIFYEEDEDDQAV